MHDFILFIVLTALPLELWPVPTQCPLRPHDRQAMLVVEGRSDETQIVPLLPSFYCLRHDKISLWWFKWQNMYLRRYKGIQNIQIYRVSFTWILYYIRLNVMYMSQTNNILSFSCKVGLFKCRFLQLWI